MSRSLRDLAYKALKAREKLSTELNREPTNDEIAREIGEDQTEVGMALDAIQDPVSLFDPIYQEGGDPICVMDQIRDERVEVDDWVRDLALSQALNRLDDRENTIIRERYFEGRTQMEVAEEIGISQAQVSRLEKAALRQMRSYV